MKNACNFATNKQKQPLKTNDMNTQTNKQTNKEKALLIVEHWGTVAALFVLPLLAAFLIEVLTK
jgi:hypothetical protein